MKPNRNRTAVFWQPCDGFLEFQKWLSPVTNVPKQQPNYRLSRTHASTVWSDRLTARSGVARQPNYSPWQVFFLMYSYVDLTTTVLNCRLPTSWHINYIGLSWCGSLITLLLLQLMVCFNNISCKNRNQVKPNVKNRPKPKRKWNSRTVTALVLILLLWFIIQKLLILHLYCQLYIIYLHHFYATAAEMK